MLEFCKAFDTVLNKMVVVKLLRNGLSKPSSARPKNSSAGAACVLSGSWHSWVAGDVCGTDVIKKITVTTVLPDAMKQARYPCCMSKTLSCPADMGGAGTRSKSAGEYV